MHLKIFPRKVICFSGMLVMLFSCRREDAPPPVPTGPVTRQETNNWILDSMHYYYLWNAGLPAQADTLRGAVDFFNSLKNPVDSFSHIVDQDNLATYPKDMLHTFGIDYAIIPSVSPSLQAIGLIKFVIPGTGAAQDGLNRGDYFTRINGTLLTASNAATLSQELLKKNTGTITTASVNGSTVTEIREVPIQGRLLLENPLYVQKIWTVNGKKTGYIFYNYFDDYYDEDLLNTFSWFKNQHINDLIIDLRYNPGGSVTAAAALLSMIPAGVSENSVFARYRGNSRRGNQVASFKDMLAFPSSGVLVPFNKLAAANLSLPKVYVLTTSQTASAAEMIVNNLKPYAQVITIGQTTYGKDKASVIITDMRNPRRLSWGLFPITYLLFNANGNGNYEKGLAPSYAVDELSKQPLVPIGDSTDPLIAKALLIITGGGREMPERNTVIPYFNARMSVSAASTVVVPH